VIRPFQARLRGAETAEDVRAGDAKQTVRAVSRQELVAELFFQRELAREDVAR
jgi:hypothetical protein